jgi:hypothetical protein
MSTRCNIIIQGPNDDYTILYKHHDGYPDGVGEELVKMLSTIEIHSDCYSYDIASEIEDRNGNYELEKGQGTIHKDIEYLYVLKTSEQKLYCYSISFGYNEKPDIKKLVNGEQSAKQVPVFVKPVGKYNTEINYETRFKELLDDVKRLRSELDTLQTHLTNIIEEYLF